MRTSGQQTAGRIVDPRFRVWLAALTAGAGAAGLVACGVMAGVNGWLSALYAWLLALPFMAGSVWLLGWAPDLLAAAVAKRPAPAGKKRRGRAWLWGGAYLFRYVWYVLPVVVMAAANGFRIDGAFNLVAAVVGALCAPVLGFAANAAVFWADVRKPGKEVIYAATGDSLTAR